jgi:hypothetical protein
MTFEDGAVELPSSWRIDEVAVDERVACMKYRIIFRGVVGCQGDCGRMLKTVGDSCGDL